MEAVKEAGTVDRESLVKQVKEGLVNGRPEAVEELLQTAVRKAVTRPFSGGAVQERILSYLARFLLDELGAVEALERVEKLSR